MDYIKSKKNTLISILCILLLIFIWAIYTNVYKQLPMFRNKTITIGVFSEKYKWIMSAEY